MSSNHGNRLAEEREKGKARGRLGADRRRKQGKKSNAQPYIDA